jgi:Na+-transporting NADH:ubiquinone oxidoreductase subunit NqrC
VEIYKISGFFDQKENAAAQRTKLLAQAALSSLPKEEINKFLAEAVRNKFTDEEIEEFSREASFASESSSSKEIDDILSKAAMEALDQIVKQDYHGPIEEGLKAKEIIDLGLAMYGSKAIVKAAFRPIKTREDL